ncbi:MAG: M48 family metallopeptidase [Thermoproteota archaeon]
MEQDEIPYEVIYRKIKHPRIEMRTGKVNIILPFSDDPKRLLNKYRTWIESRLKMIKEAAEHANGKKLLNRTDEEFKQLIYDLVKQYSEELGVKVSNVFIRHMKTKWASYSVKRNLTINRLAKHLPLHLLSYIIYHELVHAKEKHHTDRFWSIIEKRFIRYDLLEKELFAYWFIIFRNNIQ